MGIFVKLLFVGIGGNEEDVLKHVNSKAIYFHKTINRKEKQSHNQMKKSAIKLHSILRKNLTTGLIEYFFFFYQSWVLI